MKIRERDLVNEIRVERADWKKLADAIELPTEFARALSEPGPQLAIELTPTHALIGHGRWVASKLRAAPGAAVRAFDAPPLRDRAVRAWVAFDVLYLEARDGQLWSARPARPGAKPLAYFMQRIAGTATLVADVDRKDGIARVRDNEDMFFAPGYLEQVRRASGLRFGGLQLKRTGDPLGLLRVIGEGFEAVIAPKRPPFEKRS